MTLTIVHHENISLMKRVISMCPPLADIKLGHGKAISIHEFEGPLVLTFSIYRPTIAMIASPQKTRMVGQEEVT